MTDLSYDESRLWAGQTSDQTLRTMQLLRLATIVGVAYYVGAWIGFGLTLKPSPVSTLWPPNSILLAAFLLTPLASWWAILLGAFVAHLGVQLQSGIPLPMVLGWFVSNSAEGLIGASIIRRFVKGPLHFESFREVGVFVVGAAFLGTALSSFLDAGVVSLVGWAKSGYWDIWITRTPSNMLASLTLVPVIVTWVNGGASTLRTTPLRRYMEAGLLGAGLLAVCITVFYGRGTATTATPVLLYVPLPFLAWAAIRFGPRGTSACLLLVTLLAIWGAVRGHGPFVSHSPAENAHSIQLFLSVFSIPLLTLAAVMREREHAEHSARESQERLDQALCASGTGTWEWFIADDTLAMSSQARQMLGLAETEKVITLNDFLRVVSAEDGATVLQQLRESVGGGSPYECEFRTTGRDGGVRWVLSRGEVIYDRDGTPERLAAVNVDITERKLTEQLRQEEATLRESEARFRELADTMPQIVWSARPNGQLDYFNRRWYELTGASVTAADQNWLWMTHPDDRNATLDAWARAVDRGEPCEVEHRLRVQATGDYRWHLARAVPVRSREGAVVRWYGSCTDIEDQKRVEGVLRHARLELEERVVERTEELSSANEALRTEIADRVAAERALRSSEERFGKAFRASPDAMSIEGRPNERVIEINDKWATLFGFSRDETIGHSVAELGILDRRDHIRLRLLLARQGYARELELNLHNKAGEPLQAVLSAERVAMGGELCTITIIRDVTERKRAALMLQEQQRQLAHLSRVAALGELSGALAHEINQPLAAILTNARAAQRMMSADQLDLAELREILDDIASDDKRAGEVISRLRSLLKKGELQARPVKLEDIVGEVVGLLHSDLIERRVTTATQLAPNLPAVLGDRVQLQQVLLNLILNACDAMAETPPGDRRMTITTAVTAQGVVQLSVSDQGIGISETRLEPIFEPFVTTKENGLGLGLAICRSIITAHGGRLWAVNNVDRGATFLMELDPTEAESIPAIDALSEDGRTMTGLSSAGIQ